MATTAACLSEGSGVEGGPVDRLLDVAVEHRSSIKLEAEVGGTLEDRVQPGLTGDHPEELHLEMQWAMARAASTSPPTRRYRVAVADLVMWARGLAENALAESLPRRWRHVQGVAEQARNLRTLAGCDADLLEAAAVVHDIGYAPDLVDTGFHPIDGAHYLAGVGMPERLVHLVAHHSYAVLEAELRDLSAELEPFDDERGLIRDALWFCDQTTGPGGERVSARERHAEIKQRYGPGHLVTKFIERGAPELLAAVDRTEQRLAALGEPS